ncbi:hypothetical protein JHK82_053118 [Glycine max]|nr:hypothetical protein JHK85_053822 [Glycine max]KAG5085721.1 hypothetical protein JHK82_053118 [Glycine max]
MITIGTSFITEEVPGYSSLRRNLLHLAPRYPSYCRPNIWPRNALPELEVGMP